jgi:sortase B
MRKWVAGLLLSISVILLTISLYFLMGFFVQERQDNQLQQELQELMQEKEDDSEEDTSDDLEVDAGILALHEENPDCIGWLTIDGTRIDYPVMYRPGDKNYYLHRDFNGEYSANGCLFLAEECVPGNSDNLIIYGHHMNSGKMFADLEKYKDEGFYEEHPTILFRTIWGNEQYQIFAAFTTPVYTGNDFDYYSFIKAGTVVVEIAGQKLEANYSTYPEQKGTNSLRLGKVKLPKGSFECSLKGKQYQGSQYMTPIAVRLEKE